METEITAPVSHIETELAKVNITKQVIEKLKSDYLGLKINGLDDKVGFEAVEAGRKKCKSFRVLAVKCCKAGREGAIIIQKEWIEKEKEVVSEIDEVESYLEAQSDVIKELTKAILFEAAQKMKLPMRTEKLFTIGITVEGAELLKINDEQFNALFLDFYEKHLADKEEKLRLAEKKIADEKAEIDRKETERVAEVKRRKDISDAAENARIDAENKAKKEIENAKIAKEKAELKAKEDAEKAEQDKKIAFEKAEKEKADAIAKLKKEQKDKEEKAEQEKKIADEKAEKEKADLIEFELAKGDEIKIQDLQNDLLFLTTKYAFKSKKHRLLYDSACILIEKTIIYIKSK